MSVHNYETVGIEPSIRRNRAIVKVLVKGSSIYVAWHIVRVVLRLRVRVAVPEV